MGRALRHGRILRIIGLSRSGNHAIIGWILKQLRGRWCFLNCVEAGVNPLWSARPLDDGRRAIASEPRLDPFPRGRLPSLDHLLMSQEDTFLARALGPQAIAQEDEALGGAQARLDIIVLRDPWNLLASRRAWGKQAVTEPTTLRIWKQHARAFLGERSFGPAPLVGVSYNAWVREPAYRRMLADRLGLRFSDEGVDEVSMCGGGSSFDGRAYQDRARRMALFDRWRRFADDDGFWGLFDSEAVDLCEQIFGSVAPLDEPMERGARSAAAFRLAA